MQARHILTLTFRSIYFAVRRSSKKARAECDSDYAEVSWLATVQKVAESETKRETGLRRVASTFCIERGRKLSYLL